MDLPWGLSLLGFLLALHSTILVPAEAHLEHLDQGDAYDFAPNMISAAPAQAAHKAHPLAPPAPAAPQVQAQEPTATSTTNPLQRFVGSLVAQRDDVREKQRLKHVSERLAENKKIESQKENAQAVQLAAEQKKAAKMAQQIANLKDAALAQKVVMHKEIEHKHTQTLRDGQAVAAKAAERTQKLAEGTNVLNAPHIPREQAPEPSVMKRVKKLSSAPPANGISDGSSYKQEAVPSTKKVLDVNKKLHLVKQKNARDSQQKTGGYDVAAAEARAEVQDEEEDLGQAQTAVQRQAPVHEEATVFIKQSVLQDAAAKAELSLYKQQAKKQAIVTENMSDDSEHIEADEMARITKVAAQAAAKYVRSQHLGEASSHEAQLPGDSDLVLLDVSPGDAYLTASIAKMKTLSTAISQSAQKKHLAIQQANQHITMLTAELSRVAAAQKLVQNSDHGVLRMSQHELGESERRESGDSSQNRRQFEDDSSQDLGEDATIDKTQLEESVRAKVGVESMSQQESEIEHEITGLGAEEAHLEDAAHKRTAAKAAATQKKNQKAKAAAEFAAHQKDAMKKARRKDANLLGEEARLRMTTVSQVKAEAHLAAALDAQRKHDADAAKNHKPIQYMDAQAQNREMYKRMYLQNAEEQEAQAKADLKNQVSDLKENDEMHLKDALTSIKDRTTELSRSMSEVNELQERFEQDQELGESLDTTNSMGLMKKSNREVHFDSNSEHQIIVEARGILTKLQSVQGADMGFAKLAKDLLKEDFASKGPAGTDPSLVSSAASQSMQLSIGLVKFNHENTHASKLESTMHRLLDLVGKASKYETSGARHISKAERELAHMSSTVKREESELGESSNNENDEMDLGESSSTDPVPPMQAELDWEHKKLIDAQSGIQQIKLDTPRLVAMQTHEDKVKYSKTFNKANAQLEGMEKKFKEGLNAISPSLKNEEQLEQKMQQEQNRRDQYTNELGFIKRHVMLANKDMKHASHSIDDASDKLREQISN